MPDDVDQTDVDHTDADHQGTLILLSLGAGALTEHLPPVQGERYIKIGYIDEGQRHLLDEPFTGPERERLVRFGYHVVNIDLRKGSVEDDLAAVDAVYLSGGDTFALMTGLRRSGADAMIAERVRAGMPYVGLSAGAVVAGPDIEPAALMDDPGMGLDLADFRGLGLTDTVVIPHADGQLPPYPSELIDRTLNEYGDRFTLLPLYDDQALIVDAAGSRVVDSAEPVS
ncbi:Type 1 glutamine amidotransferase-like domain-containing protein [Gordonia sp. (in: high G+C Gram-positive bacteria)]|uniref:Type 1 glutamine amidotransferase-like domain-containing protein n=1 Tax=Gordonia sp. (in: high G+C Gram-positive bacteria) TaxID=84139 RepID=UPI0016BBD8CC|nr:Type 1 glutamine amidotransferase-like domain-containing protein [Gordonia sp. (in: high G+C Gram-positive bacteria)]NLG48351.1 type 1 glutamine amidotransferase-like domain-containing protein [Gordonia sp. (in: high G+C Gram-positive bacteria)]